MDIFTNLFSFFWWLLTLGVNVGGYTFTVGGAVVFVALLVLFISFLRWLFSFN